MMVSYRMGLSSVCIRWDVVLIAANPAKSFAPATKAAMLERISIGKAG
jgi:hypothetical protein